MRRSSRTVDPTGAPYRWLDFVDPYRGRVVENELDACLQERCRTQSEYDLFIEEIEARKDRAAGGLLGVPGEPGPDPVRTQPSLWEIRWSFSGDRELRLYHAEPVGTPDLLLALKYHWKRFDGMNASAVVSAQNEEMSDAAQRFRTSGFHSSADDDD